MPSRHAGSVGARGVKRPPSNVWSPLLVAVMLAMAGICDRGSAVLQVRESIGDLRGELGSTQRVHTEPLRRCAARCSIEAGVPMALTLEARDVYADPSLRGRRLDRSRPGRRASSG